MKLYCPLCKTEQPIILIFVAEKVFNTETREAYYNDMDFTSVECEVCRYSFGDDREVTVEAELVELGWKST